MMISMILTQWMEIIYTYDEYRTQLILKKERGKLAKIIRTEERERRQRRDEQNGSQTIGL